MEGEPCHYNVLGVAQSATAKEIREAYVNLSKKFHPDINPDPGTHAKFVRLQEAYNVLSKSKLRHNYDLGNGNTFSQNYRSQQSGNQGGSRQGGPYAKGHPFVYPKRENIFWDETIWHMRDKSKDNYYENGPYYRMPGVRRLSNIAIVGGCILFIGVGALFHYFAISTSHRWTKNALDERDQRNAGFYRNSKDLAEKNGNLMQLELLKLKMSSRDTSRDDA